MKFKGFEKNLMEASRKNFKSIQIILKIIWRNNNQILSLYLNILYYIGLYYDIIKKGYLTKYELFCQQIWCATSIK